MHLSGVWAPLWFCAQGVPNQNLALALSQIARVSSQLGLPQSVAESAALVYRKAVRGTLVRGRSIEGIAAAAVYAACRESKVPRTLDEIAYAAGVTTTTVDRSYRYIVCKLSLHTSPTSPSEYVPKIAGKLRLGKEVQASAIQLVMRGERKRLVQMCNPVGVAAAAIYLASRPRTKNMTQHEIARVANLSEVTVRNIVRKITLGAKQPGRKTGRKPRTGKRRVSFCVQNIVASVTWPGVRFDLRKLAKSLKGKPSLVISYNPKKFPRMAIRLAERKISFLVFEPGKATGVGAKKLKDMYEAVASLTRVLSHTGLKVPKPCTVIQNVVASFDLGTELDIEKIAETYRETEYNPESFPGVTLRLSDPKATALLFAQGRGVCAGARSIAEVRRVVKKVVGFVRPFSTCKSASLRL